MAGLTPLPTVPAAMAAIVVATDRKIVKRLRAANALDPASAVMFRPPGPIGPVRLRRLVGAGAVGQTTDGRHYLDETGYARWRTTRRKRGLAMVAIVILVIGALFLAGVFR